MTETVEVNADVDPLLVAGMVAGMPRKDLALALNISERTLRRKLAKPAMIAALAEERGEIQREILGRLNSLADRALGALAEVLDTGSPAQRIQVARIVLEQRTVQRALYEDAILDLNEIQAGDMLTSVVIADE